MCAAAASGNTELLREILELGAISVDQGDYDLRTALHLAASEGLLETVQFLVEGSWSTERLPHGANLSPVDRWGGTPLDDAVRGEQRAVADYLRARGAQSGSGNGRYPYLRARGDAVMLCVAAARGDMQCLREQVPLTLTLTLTLGTRDVRCISRRGDACLAALVRVATCSAYASRNMVFYWDSDDRFKPGTLLPVREQVLSRGKSPDLRDQNKRTPVHLAASEGQMAALRFLVEEVRGRVSPKPKPKPIPNPNPSPTP